jgi:hypothetical protein
MAGYEFTIVDYLFENMEGDIIDGSVGGSLVGGSAFYYWFFYVAPNLDSTISA